MSLEQIKRLTASELGERLAAVIRFLDVDVVPGIRLSAEVSLIKCKHTKQSWTTQKKRHKSRRMENRDTLGEVIINILLRCSQHFAEMKKCEVEAGTNEVREVNATVPPHLDQ